VHLGNAEVGVALDAIVRADVQRISRPAEAEQLVVGRQVRPAIAACHRPGDVLPAAPGQEAVVAAGDELGPVGQSHTVGPLHCRPVRQHLGPHVVSVGAAPLGADDPVAHPEVGDRLLPTVGHEHERVTS
jgi:hypothetical protein